MILTSTADNLKYLTDKIMEIKEQISETLEDFQSLKCDYL